MTEPPDDGMSDEEREDLEDFLNSEYFDEMGDDLLIDEAGRGEDNRTLLFDGDMTDEEWRLQDYLADIKEQTEDTPVPELVSVDKAMEIIAEAKKKHDEKKAAETRKNEGDRPMAINDDAQQVAQIANDETPLQAIEGAVNALAEAVSSMASAASSLSTVGENMQAAESTVATMASNAGGLLGGDEGQNISAQGQAISQAFSDALSKIANIDLGGAQEKLQGVDLAQLQGRIQQLREAIKSAAQRHMGGQ